MHNTAIPDDCQLPEQGMIGGPAVVSRGFLSSCRVINQVANEIILCIQDNGLCAFDQHACHERVRLEALEKEVYGEASDARKARTLFVPLRIRLPDKAEEVAALQHPNVRNALGRWGFQYQVDVAAKSVVVKSLPTFFTRYLEAKSAVVEPFLLALALDLQSAPPGLLSTFRPPTVQSLLASKACRGAVMFGTRLSRGEAAAIISDLRFTALPFQCAHGRPSVVPLTNLSPNRQPVMGTSQQQQRQNARASPSPRRFALPLKSGPTSFLQLV